MRAAAGSRSRRNSAAPRPRKWSTSRARLQRGTGSDHRHRLRESRRGTSHKRRSARSMAAIVELARIGRPRRCRQAAEDRSRSPAPTPSKWPSTISDGAAAGRPPGFADRAISTHRQLQAAAIADRQRRRVDRAAEPACAAAHPAPRLPSKPARPHRRANSPRSSGANRFQQSWCQAPPAASRASIRAVMPHRARSCRQAMAHVVQAVAASRIQVPSLTGATRSTQCPSRMPPARRQAADRSPVWDRTQRWKRPARTWP